MSRGVEDVPDKLTFLTTGPRKAHLMKRWIAIINHGWFEFLSRYPINDEVNLWQLGGNTDRTWSSDPVNAVQVTAPVFPK